MITFPWLRVILVSGSFFSSAKAYNYIPLWETLPATPPLPSPITTGHVNMTDGASIWYGIFGTALSSSCPISSLYSPILFLHGGFANSDYWDYQLAALQDLRRPLVVIDTRGHGRSTEGLGALDYDLFTRDVIAVLHALQIPKVSVVGWSDGGIIGLDLAMNYSSRLDRVFAFAASYDPSNIPASVDNSSVFNAYLARAETEYKDLNPYPTHWDVFSEKMNTMWDTLPKWDATSFADIPNPLRNASAPLISIVDADRDEAVERTTPLQLQEWTEGSVRVILPGVSHFAFLQDPTSFTGALRQFLAIAGV
ncbi:putative hydrolase or acyltransferase of alpha/beta superfamily [Saccharata proteae CBS 121410]|uniref:Hydrolase or acyltransferase of alpha/beta superfamily n=1 Tax=Saccharata proteae CBS 121410 TaxID=1314787 RepID=A0A9P4M003_9PEZI|nr:putative hydrolase or acyltransferase of alpha/beta superfamily [Saccharata proteae CBS 121410]